MQISEIKRKLNAIDGSIKQQDQAAFAAFESVVSGLNDNAQAEREIRAWFNVLQHQPANLADQEKYEAATNERKTLLSKFEAAANSGGNYDAALADYRLHAAKALESSIRTLIEIDNHALVEYNEEEKKVEQQKINEGLRDILEVALAPNSGIPTAEREALQPLYNRCNNPEVANGNSLLINGDKAFAKAIRTLRNLPKTIAKSPQAIENLIPLEEAMSKHNEHVKELQEAKAQNDARIRNKEAEDAAVQQSRFNASLSHGVGQINYRNYVIRSSQNRGKQLLRNTASLITNVITLGNGIRKDFDATISLSDENSERNIAYTKCKLTNAQVEHMVFAFLGRRSKEDWDNNVPVIVDGYDDDCLIRACALLAAMGIKYEFGEKTKKMFETRTDFNKQALIAHSTARFGVEMLMNRYVNGMPRNEFERKVDQTSKQLKKQPLPKSREECEQRAQKFVTRKSEKPKKESNKAAPDNPIPAPSARAPRQS